MWVKQPASATQRGYFELQLVEDGSGKRRFALYDRIANTERAALNFDWSSISPRYCNSTCPLPAGRGQVEKGKGLNHFNTTGQARGFLQTVEPQFPLRPAFCF